MEWPALRRPWRRPSLPLRAHDLAARPVELASWALAGACLGFLPFNIIRPKIFLGDVGSYAIGFWLAATALLLWDAGGSPIVLLGPFLLYLVDTATTLFRRARRGESLTTAHRDHAYQRLQQSGWSHLGVTTICAAITAISSALMLAVSDSSRAIQAVALCGGLTLVASYIWFAGHRFDTRRRSEA